MNAKELNLYNNLQYNYYVEVERYYIGIIIYLYFLDTDECAVNMGGCMQTCTNQVGSYQCGCNDGYDLDVNQHSCVGKKG